MVINKILIVSLFSIVWAIAACYFLRAGYHFVKMLSEFRSRTHSITANLFPILSIISPAIYTKEGREHLNAFQLNLVKSLLIGGVFAIGIFLLKHDW